MLNNLNVHSERSFQPSRYYDARLRRLQLCRAAKKRAAKKRAAKKRAKLQSFKKPHVSFRSLPYEIIEKIFILCLPDSEDAFKSINAAPLLLCNTSSSWRSIALSIPLLWNELSIKIIKPQVDVDLATSMVESWIARSRELPLTLCLHAIPLNENDDSDVTAIVQAHLDTFFRYASRWESVDIDVTSCSSISFPKFGPTPLLRDFSYETSRNVEIPFPFTSCPLLSTISWPFSSLNASNGDIPWRQLTDINLEQTISTHQALAILRTCRILVEFSANIKDLNQRQLHLKPVKHQRLRTFHILVYQTCSALLQSLTLPALIDFSLETDYDNLKFIYTRSVHSQLLQLFSRSECKLEKLNLGDCGFGDDGVLQCLEHESCSSLTELTLGNVFNHAMFTDEVILALMDKDGLTSEVDTILLPNLACLELEMCISASPGLFGLMVLSRCLWWDKDDGLKTLTLIVRNTIADLDDAFLKVALETGLVVHISVEPY